MSSDYKVKDISLAEWGRASRASSRSSHGPPA